MEVPATGKPLGNYLTLTSVVFESRFGSTDGATNFTFNFNKCCI